MTNCSSGFSARSKTASRDAINEGEPGAAPNPARPASERLQMMDQLSRDTMDHPRGIDTASRTGEDDARVRPLPVGHRFGELQLDAVLGVGGFGIVYRAFDRALQRVVAVKEYMPSMLATRGGDHTVMLRSERFGQAFDAGRAAFVNEARLLAQFDDPGLVKVLHFWEAHGTAYMTMPFYEGETLKQRVARGERIGEAQLREMLAGVLGALDTLHRAQCFHRDISLDNILVKPDGKPVLLDFGAARKLIGDLVDDRAVMLKPGYAPIEQYTDDPAFTQGPWTDIYGLGAVVHAVVTGELPPPAVVRSIEDKYRPLVARALPDRERYSDRFLAAIDHALAVRIPDRPESVAAFAVELGIAGFERAPQVPLQRDRNAPSTAASTTPPSPLAAAAAPASAHTEADAKASDAKLQPLDASVEPPATPDPAVGPQQKSADMGTASQPEHESPSPRPADEATTQERAAAGVRRFGGSRFALYGASALAVLLVAGIVATWTARISQRVSPQAVSTIAGKAGATQAIKGAPVPPAQTKSATAFAAPGPTSAATMVPPAASAAAGMPAYARRSASDSMTASAATVPAASLGPSETVVAIATASGATAAPVEEPPAAPKPPDTVPVRFKIRPWGEVYVGGAKRGVSPPLRTLSLAPGVYQIEIRNGNLKPLRRTLTIEAGDRPVSIDYAFE